MNLATWDERGLPESRLTMRCFHCGRRFLEDVSDEDLANYVFNETDGTFSQDDVLCPQCERDDQRNITRDWSQ